MHLDKLSYKLFCVIILLSCGPHEKHQKNIELQIMKDYPNYAVEKSPTIDTTLQTWKLSMDKEMEYQQVKNSIQALRRNLKDSNLQTDSLGKLFTTSLVHRIIPFWEGTPWSFEGHSSRPNEGEIACGYFVSV